LVKNNVTPELKKSKLFNNWVLFSVQCFFWSYVVFYGVCVEQQLRRKRKLINFLSSVSQPIRLFEDNGGVSWVGVDEVFNQSWLKIM
jgi:hypothetical protein